MLSSGIRCENTDVTEQQAVTRAEDVPTNPWYHQSEWQNASGHQQSQCCSQHV